jgi:hypothetical protein
MSKFLGLFFVFQILISCDSINLPEPDKVEEPVRETIFGENGLDLFGDNKRGAGSGQKSIGVNVFLWRATLDTMSVWPISSADPFGGVILTDWYSPPKVPNERFKMNIYILDRALRADGVRVSVFRQVKNGNNSWQDADVQPGTATKLENAILTRARQFRASTTK